MLNCIKKLWPINSWFKKLPYHVRQGKWGEAQAVRFLRMNGYRILARNVCFRDIGELDIIASCKHTLIFVEVKTRKSERYGRPVDAVHIKKRRRLEKCAIRYVKRYHLRPEFIRFDVIEVIGEVHWRAQARITHLENVFTLSPKARLWW